MHTRTMLPIGGLLAVALTLSACGGSSPTPAPTSPSPTNSTGSSSTGDPYGGPDSTPPSGSGDADVVITINGMDGSNSYSPSPVTVEVGHTVAWRNADSLPHTATADGGAFDTGTIAAGATSRVITMRTAGTFPYHCTIHGFTMTGTVTVTQ